jgi:catechol 2,3-dioxygenase-like lactoylglutathione lyase family enzyme
MIVADVVDEIDHTMLRIKDPKASLKFYTEILGMELVRKSDGGDFVRPPNLSSLLFLSFLSTSSYTPNLRLPHRQTTS